jgi:hypothetical protein
LWADKQKRAAVEREFEVIAEALNRLRSIDEQTWHRGRGLAAPPARPTCRPAADRVILPTAPDRSLPLTLIRVMPRGPAKAGGVDEPVRLGRTIIRAAVAGSLLLCATSAVLWVRSYWKTDAVEFIPAEARWEVKSDYGTLRVSNRPQVLHDVEILRVIRKAIRDERLSSAAVDARMQAVADQVRELPNDYAARVAGMKRLNRELEAIRSERDARMANWNALRRAELQVLSQLQKVPGMRAPPPRRSYVVPHWYVVAAAAFLPAAHAAWGLHRRRVRAIAARRRLCPECGYDLRATPDRCPECGTVPAPPPPPPATA